jgi:hypothetical protein
MNEQEALKKFTDSVLPLCLADSFDRVAFKDRRKAFYSDRSRRNRLPLPGLKEVAETAVSLLQSRGTARADVIEYLRTRPFFKQLGDCELAKLIERVDSSRDIYSQQTLEKIQAGRAFEAVKHHKAGELYQQATAELTDLEAQIAQRQAEYDALPSVLDAPLDEPEPAFDPVTDARKSWWERFYLRDNPFRGQSGLNHIAHDLYDQVVVRTQPFDDILTRLKRDDGCLFNTAFLLTGGFGYGKTTFLDYLSYVLLTKHNILSVRITSARPSPTAAAYMDTFLVRLKNELSKELRSIGISIAAMLDGDIDGYIHEACAALTAERYRGLLIILDDYHKHHAHSALFEFLGCLQVTKDELTRDGLRVGFAVTGLPAWREEILRQPTLGGFLDSPVVAMPDLTAESIASVINQRIAAYSFDTKPRTLRLDFVRQIFNSIGTKAGYRDYITRIVTELEQNNLAIVDSPVEIDDAELDRIKADIEQDLALKDALTKLITLSAFQRYTREQTTKCVELLVQTYVSGGVFERDRLFDLNMHYFMRLKETHLIQKKKEQHPTYGSTHAWVVHSRVQQAFERVRARSNYDPQDFFLKIYGGEVFQRRQSASVAGLTNHVENPLVEAVGFQLPDNVRSSIDSASKFFDGASGSPEPAQQAATLTRLGDAITALCNAYFELDESAGSFARAELLTAEDRLSYHWIGGEEATFELFRRLQEFRADPNRLNFEQAHKLGLERFQALAHHFVELCKDICDRQRILPFRQHARRHTDSEIEILRSVQTDYFAADRLTHYRYVERMTDEIERRLRAFLYTTTQCLFGERDYFSHAPEAVRSYAHRNAHQVTHGAIYNLYEQLTRPQYREILQNVGSPLKKHVSDHIVQWSTEEWKLFGDFFVAHTINTSHQKVAAFSAGEREQYERYCKLCRQFLEGINCFVTRILDSCAFLIPTKADEGRPEVEDCVVLFCSVQGRFGPGTSFDPNTRWRIDDKDFFKHRNLLYEHVVTRESYRSIMAVLDTATEETGHCVLDMLELEWIRTYFNAPIPEVWAALTYAVHGERRFLAIPWFGSSLLLRRVTS